MRYKNDSTTNLQARYDRLTKMHEHLFAEYLRRGRQLEESFTTIQRLRDELNSLKEVRELNLRAYDDLLTTHQRTLKELEGYQARWTARHIDLIGKNIDLQGRIDKANDELCAFRNLFADGV